MMESYDEVRPSHSVQDPSMQRLNIVVPFRDRAQHLAGFMPHLRAYFARDKQDRHIPYRVTIVEQEHGFPLNRGALKNIGFILGKDHSDYTCFHDIDYLPVWADYSWTPAPACIAWYGAEARPVEAGQSRGFVRHKLDTFFGACVLTPNDLFLKVNGYSNGYWGWGFEDEDLRRRYLNAGIEPGRRKGTFLALDHDSEGFTRDSGMSCIGLVNKRLFDENWTTPHRSPIEGVATLPFQIINTQRIPDPEPERDAHWEMVTVRLGLYPRAEQLKASSQKKPAKSWVARLFGKR